MKSICRFIWVMIVMMFAMPYVHASLWNEPEEAIVLAPAIDWMAEQRKAEETARIEKDLAQKNPLGAQLLLAAQRGDIREAERLMREGVHADYQNSAGLTPLMVACKFGNERMVDLLLRSVVPAKGRREVSRRVALVHEELNPASEQFPPELFGRIIEPLSAGVSLNIQDNKGKTTLMYAIEAGNLTIVRNLLVHAEVDVNVADQSGKTALMYAADSRAIAKLRQMQPHDLVYAQMLAHQEMVPLLITRGAHVNARDLEGKTPLMYAETAVIARALIAAGADINARDIKGRTPLMHAAHEGHAGVVYVLLSAGADRHAQDNYHHTALEFAAEEFNPDVLQAFKDNGEDLTAVQHLFPRRVNRYGLSGDPVPSLLRAH